MHESKNKYCRAIVNLFSMARTKQTARKSTAGKKPMAYATGMMLQQQQLVLKRRGPTPSPPSSDNDNNNSSRDSSPEFVSRAKRKRRARLQKKTTASMAQGVITSSAGKDVSPFLRQYSINGLYLYS